MEIAVRIDSILTRSMFQYVMVINNEFSDL